MSTGDWGNLVSLIMAMTALAGTGFTILANRRRNNSGAGKDDATALAELSKANISILAPLNEAITALKLHNVEQDKEISGLKLELAQSLKREGEYLVGIAQLTEQIVRKGDEPNWRMPARKPGTGPLSPR